MPNQTAPLDDARIRRALVGTCFADVRYLSETGSTNADAQALLGERGAGGATLVAEFQTAGIGRKGRPWIAPPGTALLFTSLLPEPLKSERLWAVPFWAALGVARALERSADLRLDLVWPNDLFADSRKVGGILSVARIIGDAAWVGCGVGINIRRPSNDPELAAIQPPPAFVSDAAPTVERETVLAEILRTFDATLADLDDPTLVARNWETRAALAGTHYRYRHDADGIERDGIAVRLGARGTLVVRDAAGEHAIDMADVRIIGRDA